MRYFSRTSLLGLTLFFGLPTVSIWAEEEAAPPPKEHEFTVVTYNVENLFDADQVAIFEDYEETGEEHGYSPAKTLKKLEGIAEVLKTFNDGAGPEIVAFSEFEIDFSPNSQVTDYAAFLEKYRDTTVAAMLTTGLNEEIRGLPIEALLLKHLDDEGMTGYEIAVGEDEPNLAAITNPDSQVHRKAHKNGVFSKFSIKESRSHPTEDARDILEVTMDVYGHPFTIFVNHWKSRVSDVSAEQSRRGNAKTLRLRLDEIFATDPSADVLVAGDFNSQHNQKETNPHLGKTAVNDVLGSQGDERSTATARGFSLYNLWYELPADEWGSDHYNGKWGTLMQHMVTPGLYDHQGIQYVDNSFAVVRVDGINTVTSLGLPRRWTNAGSGAGTSDHFPVSTRFRTVENGDPEQRLTLIDPGEDARITEQPLVRFSEINPSQVPRFDPKLIQDPARAIGEIFRVEGKISSRRPLRVEVGGQEFGLYSYDVALRKQMAQYPRGSEVDFFGQFGLHRGVFQFIVSHDTWLLATP